MSSSLVLELTIVITDQAEFMEHDEKPLPIDTRLLGALAEKVCVVSLYNYIEISVKHLILNVIFCGSIFAPVSSICESPSLQRNGV